jgi:hypothetical protein
MDAIFETAHEHLGVQLESTVLLRDFLRTVMAKIARTMDWESPLRVGENRHFPRSWQWLWQASEATNVNGEYGIRLLNRRGPVPGWPSGAGELRVRLDASRL